MSAAAVSAVCTAVVSVIGAVTALVVALRAKGNAATAQQSANAAHARLDVLQRKPPA